MDLEIEGLNLEKLLRMASENGLLLRKVRRTGPHALRVRIHPAQNAAFRALCARYGWLCREIQPGLLTAAGRFLKRRWMLAASLMLGLGLIYAGSQRLWCIRIEGAGEHSAEVNRYLIEKRICPGRSLRSLSTDALADGLALRLPGLAHTAARLEGSTLILSFQKAEEGEPADIPGERRDIAAAESGIVTRIVVRSGTPCVKAGQAVCKGQVLIAGEERTLQGTIPVRAMGTVQARVFAQGEARVSLAQTGTVETGQQRRCTQLESPWFRRPLRTAPPFESQDVSSERLPIVGLFLPVWRRTETLAETVILPRQRVLSDARSQAQGAAEKIAKLNLPADAEILDKWVDYSMIDDEFVCARVVLEYEYSIAGRPAR